MPAVPIDRPLIAAVPELADVTAGAIQYVDPITICGRCRLSFLRHPSMTEGNFATWWLCPPCRNRVSGRIRLLGKSSSASSKRA